MKYSTSEFKNGLKVIIDGSPCVIIENEFEKPGKGQAFTRIKVRNYINNKVLEKTYKSGQSIEAADIQEKAMTFLYKEGELYHFMDQSDFEQVEIPHETIQECTKWLLEQSTYQVLFWNNSPISVTPESFIIFEVTECEPGVKGDTVSGAMKNATISTGASIKVPLFIKVNEKIKVDTRNGSYVSRA